MKNKFSFLDKFITRVPFGLATHLNPIESDVVSYFSQDIENEALFLASPILHRELNNLIANKDIDQKERKKIILSLLKYYQRIKYRCTPFGLFASCGTMSWGTVNNISTIRKFKRFTRLDMHYSVALSQFLSKQLFIKPYLKFFPNSSIYPIYNKYRYVEYFYEKNVRKHKLSQVDASIYLEKIIDASQKGMTLKDLTSILVSGEIDLQTATGFLEDLVSNQLLVSELEPSVTGQELTSHIVDSLRIIQIKNPSRSLNTLIIRLSKVLSLIKVIDTSDKADLKSYEKIKLILDQIGVSYDESQLFQTDLFADNPDNIGTLDSSIKKDLFRAMTILQKLSDTTINPNLKNFQNQFSKRYEGRNISLLEALDVESGIGYGMRSGGSSDINVLVDDVLENSQSNNNIAWDDNQDFLFKKLIDAQYKNEYSVQLTEIEFNAIQFDKPEMPDSLSVLFSILHDNDDDKKILFNGAYGTSASNLLGRFAASNTDIFNIIKKITSEESKLNPNKILAEINHLPENRIGNVLLRPHLRDHEISYLSTSTLKDDGQLPLRDLEIKIVDERIVIWSISKHMEIIPRMSNAHNYSLNPLPVYHFLCELQSQNSLNSIAFNWGEVSNKFSFLPRVEIGRVVVFPATWKLNKANDYETLIKEFTIEKLENWKTKWKIPNQFYLCEGDNKLLIDLANPSGLLAQLFIDEIKKKKSILLQEYLFDHSSFLFKNNSDGRVNEFIAPIIKQRKEVSSSVKFEAHDENLQSIFPIGSNWIYYKLYTGLKMADYILKHEILSLCQHLLKENYIDAWFFIRYSDPDPHLRIRFHIRDLKFFNVVCNEINDTLKGYVTDGIIWNIQMDSYRREIDRYGGSTIESIEKLFFYDSMFVLDYLLLIDKSENDNESWIFALISLNRLLDDFGFSLDQKINLLEALRKKFKAEFNLLKTSRESIDKKYRANRNEIEIAMLNKNHNPRIDRLSDLLYIRSKKNKGAFTLESYLKEGDNAVLPFENVVSSILHMSMNRLFRNKQRKSEMMIYDFLCRHLLSKRAILDNEMRKPNSQTSIE